jgi:hypothetical protein
MLMLRVAAALTVIAIAAGALAYLFTGQRRYLNTSLRIAKYALWVVLAIVALMFFERLVLLV